MFPTYIISYEHSVICKVQLSTVTSTNGHIHIVCSHMIQTAESRTAAPSLFSVHIKLLAIIQLLGVTLTSKSHDIVVSSSASNLNASMKLDVMNDPSCYFYVCPAKCLGWYL
jgi:hypothetical protein